MKYYFVSYRWRYYGDIEWEFSNCVLNNHPLLWLKNLISNKNIRTEYQIEFYEEITEEEFSIMNGLID